jgi:hypothetical protein
VRTAKFWVAIAYAMAIAADQIFVDGTAKVIITIILAGLSAATVYAVPNTSDRMRRS